MLIATASDWEYNIRMNILKTVPAHFDGKEIILDVPTSLEPNTRLLVTILSPQENDHLTLVRESMAMSENAFARIWDNDEDAVYDNL